MTLVVDVPSRKSPQAHTKRALIYLRVSTKDQAERGESAEGFSIPAQREACHLKAESLGAEVLPEDEFIDAGESARSADRPELQRMLRVIAEESPDFVIVHKVDRLARNRMDDLTISLLMEKSGTQLVSCNENIDPTPTGKLTHGLMALIAEFYSSNLSNEIRTKTMTKVKNGGTPTKAPIGYLNVRGAGKRNRNSTVVIDEERAPHIQWAFSAYATGEYTIKGLALALFERGLRRSRSMTDATSSPLTKSSLQRVLTNKYYIGIVTWKGVEYAGKHPPLIDKQVFDDVQAMLGTHRNGEKERTHTHYLRSSVYCGSCGSRLCFTQTVNRYGSEYPYFFCLGRQQKRTSCKRKYVSVQWVEEQVEDKWKHVALSESYADALLGELEQAIKSRRDDAEALSAGARSTIASLKHQHKKLLDAYYLDAFTPQQFKAEQARINEGIEKAERRMTSAQFAVDEVEKLLRQCMHLAHHGHDLYMHASPTIRRQLNQAMFDKFYVDEEGVVRAEPTGPFAVLLHPDLLRGGSTEDGSKDEAGAGEKALKAEELKRQPNNGECRERTGNLSACHNNKDWLQGTPLWLNELWARNGEARCNLAGQVLSTQKPSATCVALGSREDSLVPGAGLEPA